MTEHPFYNRERERDAIQTALTSPKAELVIVFGRRGVGKSALLQQVTADSPDVLFYRATRRTINLQLQDLTEAAGEAFSGEFLVQPFASTAIFLEFLSHLAVRRAEKRIIVVLDELPYLAEADPGFLTTLQHWWDANKHHRNLKLFLSGSVLSFMERQVLDVGAPLYNRRTGAMKLEPLDYAEAGLFFPGYLPTDRMLTYSILGGMPAYLEQWDRERSIAENVCATILRRNTYLSEEPEWLLLSELRRDVTYASILRAIATGARKPSDIARSIGKDSAGDVAPQLATLQHLGLVRREVPVTERAQARSRNSLYWLSDAYLDFWYRFVDPARSLIARGLGERLWEHTIAPVLHDYASRPSFEIACRQYVWRALASGILPDDLILSEVGTWWSGDTEIDVVALDSRGKVVLAGSCKWTEDAMEVRDYAELQRALSVSRLDTDNPALLLFSRGGFSDRLQTLAEAAGPEKIRLIDLEAMYAV